MKMPKEEDKRLGSLEIPQEIKDEQEKEQQRSAGSDLENDSHAELCLFFSFDIVNSTQYKTTIGCWPVIIRGLLEDIRSRVFKTMGFLQSVTMWRVIGDEVVFVTPVYSTQDIFEAVDAIFEVTQRECVSLKTGKFFENIENQSISGTEIEFLKTQRTLSIKSAAWIAAVNKKIESQYDNLKFMYSASEHNEAIREYLGVDIDTGFRIKGYTKERRLVVSIELAHLLLSHASDNKAEREEIAEKLHIVGYDRLKGVWNGDPYPIIWYHNKEKVKNAYEAVGEDAEGNISFEESFRYDIGNEIVRKGLFAKEGRSQEEENSIDTITRVKGKIQNSMYNSVEDAIKKIAFDRFLKPKFEYYSELLGRLPEQNKAPSLHYPLEFHCAVVCCDVKERSAFITRRGLIKSTNPQKWEFGCAKAESGVKLVDSIKEYYLEKFGLEIELVVNRERNEVQPLPIAIYEIDAQGKNKKGVIFVAAVKQKGECRSVPSHECAEWIKENELGTIKKEDAVEDFHNTLRTVFSRFDEFFKE